MKFFEAQKRASFAAKLFATVNFDFEAALKANDETALKTAFDAQASTTSAASAELQKELDELALDYTKIEGELAQAKKDAKAQADVITVANSHNEAFCAAFAAVGLTAGPKIDAKEFKTAFEAHVAKQTTLALAKTGHPPTHVPKADAIDDVTPVKTDTDKAALKAVEDYEALIVADNSAHTKASEKAKKDFYKANSSAIERGLQLRKRSR